MRRFGTSQTYGLWKSGTGARAAAVLYSFFLALPGLGRAAEFSPFSPAPAGIGLGEALRLTEVPEVPAAPSGIPFNGATFPRTAFTGKDQVSALLVRAIDRTQGSLKIAIYDFTLQDVLEALQRAAQRSPKIQIQVVIDQGHVYPRAGKKASAQITALLGTPGIETRMLSGVGGFGIMHNKLAVFDGRLVEWGSYNWGRAAETMNWENANFSVDPVRVDAFGRYWQWMWSNAWASSAPRTGPPDLSPGPPEDASRSVRLHDLALPGSAFSPNGGVRDWLLKAIRASRSSIDIAMFNFSSQDLADALLERKLAGVKIRLVLDRRQTNNNKVVPFLKENGFDLLLKDGRTEKGVLHHKFAIFDRTVVETGAYNWSNNAEVNSFECVTFSDDASDAAAYQSAFDPLYESGTAAIGK